MESFFMWNSRKDEKPSIPPPQPVSVATPVAPPKEVRPMETPKMMDNFRAEVAHIGKSVVVKGELSGSEDLYLDGEVEGNIELHDHALTIGPNGKVKANIHARDVVVHGKVDGNIAGTERVELKKSAILSGDITTQRIIIEDGAFFKGAIDIQKETPKVVTTKSATASVGTAAASYAAASPAGSSAPVAAR
jgi:cytoskeletal protein CcmA (bactofilin family)